MKLRIRARDIGQRVSIEHGERVDLDELVRRIGHSRDLRVEWSRSEEDGPGYSEWTWWGVGAIEGLLARFFDHRITIY